MNELTLADLMRIAAWAIFGGLPMFLSYAMGEQPEMKSDATKAFLYWTAVAAQIAFGVAAYMAGGKR